MATEAAGSQDNALMSSSNNPSSQQQNVGNPAPGEGSPSSKPPPQPIAPATPSGSTKTEKPRPHVCGTCQRSFARLEHLKRHERSHTKEKPFECPECNRCFARRDLLLRHQQKLHMAGPSGVGRPRGGPGSRRESTGSATSTATGRVRKNSMPSTSTSSVSAACIASPATSATAAAVAAAVAAANTAPTALVSTGDGGAATMRARPRANTIAHIDSSTLGRIANSTSMGLNQAGRGGSNRGRGSGGVVLGGGGGGGGGLDVSGTGIGGQGFDSGTANRQDDFNLPKIDTSISSLDLGGMMPRSAGMFSSSSSSNYEDLEGFFLGNTINPTMLHFNMSSPHPSSSLTSPPSPFGQSRSGVDSTYYSVDDCDDDLEWMSLLGNMMGDPVDQSSSPSAFSTASGGAASEVVPFAESLWQTGSQMPFTDFRTPNFTDTPPPDSLSVEPSTAQLFSPRNSPPTNEGFAIPTLASGGGSGGGDGGGNGDASGNGGIRTLSPPAESVTDASRAALATTLVRGSAFGVGIGASHHPLLSPFQQPHNHAHNSQRAHSAHRSHQTHHDHHHHHRRHSVAITGGQTLNANLPKHGINLPLTRDLQRYVDAYIRFFHPHLPFLHIPTLRFDPLFRGGNDGDQLFSSHGREYLVLSMAAIGALYEFEQQAAGELFEAAKKTVEIFLDERRKAPASNPAHPLDTPLWLIQAMLLNSIFGLQCGDRSIGEAAYGDVSTLVQLARTAGLTRPTAVPAANSYNNQDDADIQMSDLELSPSVDSSLGSDGWCGLGIKVEADEGAEWSNWVMAEERKRTLYAVHFLSSLLVAAHNQDPKLVNNEIRLDLPCSEDLWNAPTANVWNAKGGSPAALQSSPNFAAALNGLLSAGQQQYGILHSQFQNFNHSHSQHGGIHSYPPGGHVPSTFGCLVLICALHAYIWETRQNNPGRHWTSPEAEVMHAHIEPGLKAWQSAWYMTPHHSIERPNPFNMGTLSADCIPLLDLAYIRLFVDLGRTKEYFWNRNFEAMADELAKGSEGGQSTPISSASSFSARSGSPISNAISPASSPGSTSTSPGLYPIKIGAGGSVNPAAVPRYAEPVSFHMVPPQTLNYIHTAALCEPSSHRERHLRRAAFYAADSLAMSDTLGTSKNTSYAADQDLLCRELPIQSALCLFDCAQILAEWIATVQVRVAPYMGLITLENCELDCLEAIMNLENEDRKLLGKVRDMLQAAESKVSMELPRTDHPFVPNSGLGPTVLRVSAYLLEQAVVWPATRIMAQALSAQAEHMDIRIRSVLPLQN